MVGTMRRRAGKLVFGVAMFYVLGCHGPAVRPGRVDVGPESVGPTYRLRGVVLGKSAKMHEITVHQEVIRDFEPSMNAVYRIDDESVFDRLKPGVEISGKVIPSFDGIVNGLEGIAITSQPGEGVEGGLPPHLLLMGEQVPQIPMVNQDGRSIEFAKFRGKTILITFIDSKCTDDCPILTRRFERINTLLAANRNAYSASQLISISIDPAADTPRVLRKYGLSYLDGNAAGFAHWEFTDVTPANLKRLAAAFGVDYRENHGDIDHTMLTALIGPDGNLVRVWGGDQWDPAVLAKAVEASAQNTAGS